MNLKDRVEARSKEPSHHTKSGFVLQASRKEGGQGPTMTRSPRVRAAQYSQIYHSRDLCIP